jgi:hypothetical protein
MSFRQFGGLNYSARNNIVANNYNTSNNLLVTQNVGQSNSYINFLSDISGNQIFGDVDISGNLFVTGNTYVSGITGATGSFSYLTASQLISAPAGITGSTSNFSGQVSASSFLATSDYRIKERVIPLNRTSYTIDSLIPVTYFNKQMDKQDIGLIAHELQEHIPELVSGEKDGKELQTINYMGLIAILIKEIQDLKKEIILLKKRNKIN